MTTKASAFTLLEVMAAMAILSISLVVLIQSQTMSLNATRSIKLYERAVFITENQLHWTFLDLNEAESWEEYATLNGEDGDFLYNVRIEPAEMEKSSEAEIVILKVIATTTWQEGSHEAFFELETMYLWGQQR